MKCPICKDVDLLVTQKKGVEIEYCKKCHGIWIDWQELGKIVEEEEKYFANKNYKEKSIFSEIFDLIEK